MQFYPRICCSGTGLCLNRKIREDYLRKYKIKLTTEDGMDSYIRLGCCDGVPCEPDIGNDDYCEPKRTFQDEYCNPNDHCAQMDCLPVAPNCDCTHKLKSTCCCKKPRGTFPKSNFEPRSKICTCRKTYITRVPDCRRPNQKARSPCRCIDFQETEECTCKINIVCSNQTNCPECKKQEETRCCDIRTAPQPCKCKDSQQSDDLKKCCCCCCCCKRDNSKDCETNESKKPKVIRSCKRIYGLHLPTTPKRICWCKEGGVIFVRPHCDLNVK